MAALCPLSLTALHDENGRPLVGAIIRFFDAGTTTPRTAYRDRELSTAYERLGTKTNSVGRIPVAWLEGQPYRVQIASAGGTLIEDIDGIPAEVGEGVGTPPPADTAIATGDVVWSYRIGPRAGWVRPNGRTIGSAASGASERANADVEALFLFLWNQDGNLAVSGGRGMNAAADWAADKTITLPDMRARAPFGMANMGNAAIQRLKDATFEGGGNHTTLGSAGGEGAHILTVDELASHKAAGKTAAGGVHVHTGATDGTAAHVHTGTTGSAGAHNHDYDKAIAAVNASFTPAGLIMAASSSTKTSSDGAHTHPFTTDAAGAHSHPFTTGASASHVHDFESDAIGSDKAHNNMPPFVLGTWYMRL